MLDAAQDSFDVLVTMDRNLVFQQRLAGRRLAVVVVRVTDQSPQSFEAIVPALDRAISGAAPGQIAIVGDDGS